MERIRERRGEKRIGKKWKEKKMLMRMRMLMMSMKMKMLMKENNSLRRKKERKK